MKKFNYIALDVRGQESKGGLDATDSVEALQRLKEMGLFPTKITQNDPPSRPSAGRESTLSPDSAWLRVNVRLSLRLPGTRERVKPKLLAVFTRQLSTLLEAGMPLLRGLRILEEQERNQALRKVIRRLTEAVENGGAFSEGLACSPQVFNPLYISMTKAGEASGALDVVLDRLAGFMEKAGRIKGKVKAAMFYSAAVLTVAVVIVSALMVFVIPKFSAVFTDLMSGQPLPVFTQAVLGVSQFVKDHVFFALGTTAGVLVALRLFVRTSAGRRSLDRFKLFMPVFGPVFSKAAISRFSRTLGTLMSSGVPILQALSIVKETAGNVIVGEAVDAVHRSVKEGETIALPLRASGVFPALVVGMVDIGEQTGALPDMLMRIADNYDDEVDNAVSAMTSLLEPIMIVILAVLVGSIVIALFLPMIAIINDPKADGSEGGGAN